MMMKKPRSLVLFFACCAVAGCTPDAAKKVVATMSDAPSVVVTNDAGALAEATQFTLGPMTEVNMNYPGETLTFDCADGRTVATCEGAAHMTHKAKSPSKP